MRTYECEPTLTDTQVLDFCKKGFWMLEGVVPAEINARTLDYLEAHPQPEPTGILFEPWFHENVIVNPAVAGAVRSLLGRDFGLPNLMSNHRVQTPAGPQQWHRDGGSKQGPQVNYLQVFYLPQACSVEQGPTELLPGSHHVFSKSKYMAHYGQLRGTYYAAAPAGSVFLTQYSIWHRRSGSSLPGLRNLLKYNYWRTTAPERSWLAEPGFDPRTADYTLEYPHMREQFQDCVDAAQMYFWLGGQAPDFHVMGGQGWPVPGNFVEGAYGYPGEPTNRRGEAAMHADDQPLRVGVIGAGRIGRLHAENIAARVPEAEVTAIADVDLGAAQTLARRLRVPRATADYREVLADPAVQAVLVCSSTDTHATVAGEAAAAGKHIFCEKPIDLSLERIDAVLRAVDQAGVTFQVGFNRRFDPSMAEARRLVAEGKIGRPHLLRITSRDPGPPPLAYLRASGGLFLDMMVHDFDMARFLMGSEVTELYAQGAVLVDPEIGAVGDLDTAVVTLTFANGALGTIDNSRRAVYGYDQRVEVLGDAGMVAVGNQTPDTHVYSSAEGVRTAKPLHFFVERYTEAYAVEVRAFVAAVRGGTSPPVTGADGRVPVVMGLAARRSFEEQRPVKLSEIE